MIQITVNGKKEKIDINCLLADALQQWGYQANYFAVAVNQCFVSRANYHAMILKDHDVIEIVAPLQGG